MEKPPLKAFGRLLNEFEPLMPAEKILLDACRCGHEAIISRQRPEHATKENTVRSSFLRFLALGGDEFAPVHEKGVFLVGAWVEGELDMDGAYLPRSFSLINCYLSNIKLVDSNIHGCLCFRGCHVNSLKGDSIVCSGDVLLDEHFISIRTVSLTHSHINGCLVCSNASFNDANSGNALAFDSAIIGHVRLSNGFSATGTVRLLGAEISNNLECNGGKFNGKGNESLFCDGAVIKGSVSLNDNFTATGEVRFLGAQIGGSLECSNANFCNVQIANVADKKNNPQDNIALVCDRAVIKGSVVLASCFCGTVRLLGVLIGSDLVCVGATFNNANGIALYADNMTVVGAFRFHNLKLIKGIVSLFAVKVGILSDNVNFLSAVKLKLDGFVYDRLIDAPTDAKTRIAWLNRQSKSEAGLDGIGKEFKPQPWQQLQKVLREMGHIEDARQVAIAFEDRLRKANLIGQTNCYKPMAWIYQQICCFFHWCFGWLIGYGYRPLRLFIIMLGIWLACGAFYSYAAYEGVFAPSNPLVFQNPEYDICTKAEIREFECTPKPNWYLCSELREEYTGFSPFLYSLDLILPLVDLQQEHDWSPMIPTPKNTWFGELKYWEFPKHCTRFLMWFEILFGWMASLLLVAVVSGLTKRREE